MASLSFNPKKIIRGIFRRHKSDKTGEAKTSSNGSLKFGGRLKAAKSCPFVHVETADECSKSNFQSRLSLWTEADAGTPGSYLNDEVMVRSPHHSLRLSTDLLLISQSRCDNPVVRDLLNDESSLELVDEFSPNGSSLSPRPVTLAISPKSSDVASVRSQEEAIFGVEAIHQFLVRSPPPMLARGVHRENVFVFPVNSSKKTARCMSEVNFSPSKTARLQQPAACLDAKLQSLPGTPHKGKDRNWVGRSAPDMSHILTAACGSQQF